MYIYMHKHTQSIKMQLPYNRATMLLLEAKKSPMPGMSYF